MKAYELYHHLPEKTIHDMLQWYRDEDRETYKTALATLATNRKLRPVFVTKKSVPEQFEWLHKTLKLKTSEMMAEHLFQNYLMTGKKDMLVTFCDAVGIEHDGNGTVEGDLPETLETEKLKQATDALLEKHEPGLVSAYLHVFAIQTDDGWENLNVLLKEDPRIALSV